MLKNFINNYLIICYRITAIQEQFNIFRHFLICYEYFKIINAWYSIKVPINNLNICS